MEDIKSSMAFVVTYSKAEDISTNAIINPAFSQW